jgi:hypothetical protein
VERITNNRWLFFILGFFLGAVITLFFYDGVVNIDECEEIIQPGDSVVINGKLVNLPAAKTDKIVEEKPVVSVEKKKKDKAAKKNDTVVAETKVLTDTVEQRVDSLTDVSDSVNADDYSVQSDIEVMQDELLFSKQIIPDGDVSVFLCDAGVEYDSLLVDNTAVNRREGLTVEFWISPVNFRGYKLNSRKLVLFGVVQFDSLSLKYQQEKVLLMKYKNQEFQLHCSDEFMPLNIRN